jgi:Transposase DNA-binding/Transposase Tn5 dimerisation domain
MSVSDVLDEVRHCDFGDVRLNDRLNCVVERLSQKPNMSIPAACANRAEMEATYRFFNNDKVSADAILDSHARASIERIRNVKVALLVQDTTEIDLSRPDSIVQGAGPLNSDVQLGALYHPMMAFDSTGIPLGTVWHKRWVRESIHQELTQKEKDKIRKTLPVEEKESFRWIEGVRKAKEIANDCPDTCCVCIADSEADIYELFAESRQTDHGELHFLVRGCHDRVIYAPTTGGDKGTKHKIIDYVMATPVVASQMIDISKRECKDKTTKKKRKAAREARTAEVEIRAASVMIAKPSQCNSTYAETVTVNIVMVQEINAPAGEEPIQWILITTLPIDTEDDVQLIIQYYCYRWQIEVYFRTLKSGCRIEERYFARLARLEKCFAVYVIIAWRILYMCRLSHECPDMSCEVVFTPSEWKAVTAIVKREVPTEPPSLNEMVKMVASLGGYVIRNKTRPGTQTLWLGLQRVHDLSTAWKNFGPESPNQKKF